MNTPTVFSGQSGSELFTAVTHTETRLVPVTLRPERDCLSSTSAHARTSEGQTQQSCQAMSVCGCVYMCVAGGEQTQQSCQAMSMYVPVAVHVCVCACM